MRSVWPFWSLWRGLWAENRGSGVEYRIGSVALRGARCGESGEEPQCRMQARFESRHAGNPCEWVSPDGQIAAIISQL
jgi:hypothetical protein